MADTHINAYFSDVDEAELKLRQAQGELSAAKLRLENKKIEVGWDEPVQDDTQESSEVDSSTHEVKALPHMDNPFKKKR